jgi:hypothetical protein
MGKKTSLYFGMLENDKWVTLNERTAYETHFVQRKQIYSTNFFLGTRAYGRPRGCCSLLFVVVVVCCCERGCCTIHKLLPTRLLMHAVNT